MLNSNVSCERVPPTQPLIEENSEPSEENLEVDDGLPPLVPMEESDIPSGPVQGEVDQTHEESNQGQTGGSSSRNPGSGSSTPSRNLRQLRNRTVARSIRGNQSVKFNEVIDCVCQDQERVQFEKEGTLFPPLEQREDLDYLSQERWELLYDPTPSRALKRTRQRASIVAQQILSKPHVSTVCLMDQKKDTAGYTVLSDSITKKMDREERKYQKAMMICVQGIGASLNKSTEALDIVDGLGQSHHDALRNAKWEMWGKDSLTNSVPSVQPWASVIQQTLSHQNVPEYFQKDDTMKYSAEIVEEEEVLQTTTCTPRDIYTDIKGWTTAFEVELFSFQTLDVKLDVREDTLDLRRVTILPGKAVMVKKPNGDGTHKKKARVVVCGNFQQVQPGEETCANTPSFPLRTSPKAWEEERDQKLGQLQWDTPQGRVGLVKVESANCVWMIEALDDKTCSNPLGMVIAYVDDISAVGEQETVGWDEKLNLISSM